MMERYCDARPTFGHAFAIVAGEIIGALARGGSRLGLILNRGEVEGRSRTNHAMIIMLKSMATRTAGVDPAQPIQGRFRLCQTEGTDRGAAHRNFGRATGADQRGLAGASHAKLVYGRLLLTDWKARTGQLLAPRTRSWPWP